MRAKFVVITTLLMCGAAHSSEVLPGCNTDEDCNLNGRCIPGGGGSLPWSVRDGENAVWGRDLSCGGVPGDPGISALGFVNTSKGCWSLCNQSKPKCFGFAYHHSDHPNKKCARGCFGLLDGTWAPVDEDHVTSGRGPRSWTGTCSCNEGWTGESCGLLDLVPMASDAPPAYGTIPTAQSTGLATWGGSIVRDPDDEQRWHLYASEISHGCGLDAWGRNSVIVHATASSPMGPYARQSELLPYFAHEPTVVELPAALGGGYVLYKIGCADGAVTGSNGTGLVGPCTDCSNGTSLPKAHCPPPTQVYERACQDVLHAPHPQGPWKRANVSMPQWDWLDVNLGLESHAPVVLENGTVLTLTRSWGTPPPYPNSAFWLIRADSWDGDYYKVPNVPQPFLNVTMEDSFMWRDVSGNFHALFHAWAKIHVGAHAFSRDGLRWTLSPTRAYGNIVQTTSGGTVQYSRRERPHLRANEAFGIRHYAGEVIYSGASGGSTSWLDKNTLALEFDVENTLARSPLYDLFSKPTVATRTTTVDGKAEKRTVPRTVCHNFIRDVDQLMETLKAVDTHFIRCMRPNAAQVAGQVDQKVVLNQLRCNGTIEAVEVLKVTYPTRFSFAELHKALAPKFPKLHQAAMPSPGERGLRRFLDVIVGATLTTGDYKFGRTMVFFKAGKDEPIERLMHAEDDTLVERFRAGAGERWREVAQSMVGFAMMASFKRKLFVRWHQKRVKAATKLQRQFRLKKSHLMLAVEIALQAKRESAEAARKSLREVERKAAATSYIKSASTVAQSPMKAMQSFMWSKTTAETKKVQHQSLWHKAVMTAEAEDGKTRSLRLATKAMQLAAEAEKIVADEAKKAERKALMAEKRAVFEPKKDLWAPQPVEKVFEVTIERDEHTGGLGVQLDEFHGEATITLVEVGGAAARTGAFLVSDELIAVDGKDIKGLDQLTEAVVHAASSAIKFKVRRRKVKTVRSGEVMMELGGHSDYERYVLTLTSSRTLNFESAGNTKHKTSGTIDILNCQRVNLVKHGGQVHVRIVSKEKPFEFFGRTTQETLQWEGFCSTAAGFGDADPPLLEGWMHWLHKGGDAGRRRYFELYAEPASLLVYDALHSSDEKLAARTALGVIDFHHVRRIKKLSPKSLIHAALKFQPLSDALLVTINLGLDAGKKIGVHVDESLRVTKCDPFSVSHASLQEGKSVAGKVGLRLGDRVVCVRGSYVHSRRELETEIAWVENEACNASLQCSFVLERPIKFHGNEFREGGLFIEDQDGKQWAMTAASADTSPLDSEAMDAIHTKWLTALQEIDESVKQMERNEHIMMEEVVEIEEEAFGWIETYCIFSVPSGLWFYTTEMEGKLALGALKNGDEMPEPAQRMGLDEICGGRIGYGLEYYEGIVHVTSSNEDEGDLAVRFGSASAGANFLSALNIYARGKKSSALENLRNSTMGGGDASADANELKLLSVAMGGARSVADSSAGGGQPEKRMRRVSSIFGAALLSGAGAGTGAAAAAGTQQAGRRMSALLGAGLGAPPTHAAPMLGPPPTSDAPMLPPGRPLPAAPKAAASTGEGRTGSGQPMFKGRRGSQQV